MSTLIARLGLRAAEVAGLDLGDVDWRAGELAVRGKGRRVERLPLPADAGEALAGYRSEHRPLAESRAVVTVVARSGGACEVRAGCWERGNAGGDGHLRSPKAGDELLHQDR